MANIDKNQIGYNEVMAAGTANALMVQYKRANAAPLDITDVFTSFENALDYAANGATSYAGQVIAVAGDGVKTQVYKITSGGTLVELVDAEALAELANEAGKIDEIKLNGSALTIVDKSVNIDLSAYGDKAWVTAEITKAATEGKVDLNGYATEQWVLDKGYITANDESVTNKALQSDVDEISSTLEKLIGDDTNQSIRQIAKNEVAGIVGSAPEAFDTLEEIASWISSDSAGTEALVARIGEIESDIEILSGDSHTHENKEVLDGITAEQVTAWDGAEAAAKAYADGKFQVKGDYEAAGAAAQALADAKADAAEKYQVKGEYEVAGAAAEVKSWVEEQKYLTEHQDISTLATKDEVAAAEAAAKADAAEKYQVKGDYEVAGAAAQALADAKTYVDDNIKTYNSGIATNVDSGNNINVLVQASTETEKNWLKVKEDNSLAVNEIGLDDAVTTKEITIEGGKWADAVKTVFTGGTVPVGTSWQSFLEAMLCVEKFAGTISTTNSFSVTCTAPGAGITGATNESSVEVGTKVILAGVSAQETKASQSITVKTFTYGYKVGENGAYNSATAYTETLTPTLKTSTSNLKETFSGFTSLDGTAIATKTGADSLDAVEMYVAEGENKAVVSQTGDTYTSSTAVTAGTLYVATNLKNYYKADKTTVNTYTPTAKSDEKTATNSSTYTITGYRNTFYGTTSSTATADAAFIRELTKSGHAVAADGTLTIKTTASDGHIRMVIASPRTIKTVANRTNTQDITVTLSNTHKTVSVPGANNYDPISYNVYDYTWNSAFGTDEWIITFN